MPSEQANPCRPPRPMLDNQLFLGLRGSNRPKVVAEGHGGIAVAGCRSSLRPGLARCKSSQVNESSSDRKGGKRVHNVGYYVVPEV